MAAGDNWHVVIEGRKVGRPSKRISLHQRGLRLKQAKVIQLSKLGPIEHEVSRINHLPSLEQVRLHTAQVIYPGKIQIELEYLRPKVELDAAKPNRTVVPSVDEPDAWAETDFELKR